MSEPNTLPVPRTKTAFWRDGHFWSAVGAALAPELLAHFATHLPGDWGLLLLRLYGALVAAGIIAARRHNETDLGLSSGLSSTQPEEAP